MIWTKKASLVKRVLSTTTPGKEAKDGSSFRRAVAEARRHGDLVLRRVASPRSYPKSLRQGKMALARLDLHARGDRMGLSLAMPQSRTIPAAMPWRGLIAWRLAQGLPPCSADTGAYCTAATTCPKKPARDWCATPAGRSRTNRPASGFGTGDRVRGWTARPSPCPTRRRIRRPIRNRRQKPGCGFPIARILVIFSLSVGTVLEAAIGKYKGKQTGENSLFRRLYGVLRRRRRDPGGPLFQRLVRHCLAAATRRRHASSASINCGHGLSHGQAIGQGRPLGGLDAAATTEMDVAEQYATLPES